MRYAMMIELDKCVGCQACVTSCKERWDSGPAATRNWVMTFTHGNRERGDLDLSFYPGLCNHCDDHPCTEECPTGATYMTDIGIVVVDPDVCIGCGNCVPHCPYGARHADDRQGIVEKCNFCAPYVARGEEPACVASCLADCRHFGDLDAPDSALAALIKERQAEPLTTNEINVGPRIYYAPAEERLQVLAQGVVRRYGSTLFSDVYQYVTKPLSRWVVAPVILVTGAAGIVANLRQLWLERGQQEEQRPQPRANAPSTLPRHPAGMRFLHWFNLFSWFLLLPTGTALMSTSDFALFGTGFSEWLAGVAGGKANLIWFHAAWGMLWSVITVPLFTFYKRGGIEALHELWPCYDDVRWLWIKPLVMVGILGHDALPPQDKYNFGQKLFAVTALVGTATLIASGMVMTFHVGPPEVVRAAIMIHKLAVMLALTGIAVHITMAAILAEERPALWSMIVGQIDEQHAKEHSAKWVAELEENENAEVER